jgi:dTDP-4-amino-4,6-dideoxygalactose transaminase/GNAT superfamily N-acetyltransferase
VKSPSNRSGDVTAQFEQRFAEVAGRAHAIAFGFSRHALCALLEAAGVPAGSEVVLPPLTCKVVPLSLLGAGYVPIYADISATTLNLDAGAAAARIGPQTGALLFQHTYGNLAGVEPVADLAGARGLPMIEDCAQCTPMAGAKAPGGFGRGAFFSNNLRKPVPAGSGGAAVTDDPELARAVRAIRDRLPQPSALDTLTLGVEMALHAYLLRPSLYWPLFALSRRFRSTYRTSSRADEVRDEYELTAKRVSNSALRVGLRWLERVVGVAEHRRSNVAAYRDALSDVAGLKVVDVDPSLPLFYVPVLVEDKPGLLSDVGPSSSPGHSGNPFIQSSHRRHCPPTATSQVGARSPRAWRGGSWDCPQTSTPDRASASRSSAYCGSTSVADVEITLAKEEDFSAVERFCDETPEAIIYYRPRWQQVLAATYGHARDHWVARSEGRVVGLFPVDVIQMPLLGTKTIASAYQFEGGLPLAQNDTVRRRLINAAVERAQVHGARFLEVRSRGTSPWLEDLGFVPIDSQLLMQEVDLTEGIGPNKIRRGHRRDIKFARDHGVTVTAESGLEHWRRFRRMYLKEGRRKAAPQQGWNFFRNMHAMLPDWSHLFLARDAEGQEIGGVFSLDDGERAFARHGAYSTETAKRLRVGKLLISHLLVEAAGRGCQSMSLGMSWVGDHGLIQNKEGFQAVSHPVWLYVLPLRNQPPAPGSYFEGFSLAKTIWRRMPLPVLERAGRLITHWIC